MKKLVVIGNGPYSEMMHKYAELTEFGQVVAYAVDEQYIQAHEINGKPVIALQELEAVYSCKDIMLLMGIGYKNMGEIRAQVFQKCKNLGFRFINYIHPTAIISKDVVMGEGNNILEGVILEAGVRIGDANLLFGGSMIAHDTVIGSFNTLSVKAVAAGCTVIGSHCFLGASSVVRDHVVFQDYVLLGASAYGFKSMEKYAVVEPARSVIVQNKKSIDFL